MDSESDFEILDQSPGQVGPVQQKDNTTDTTADNEVSEVHSTLLEPRGESGELLHEPSAPVTSNSDPQPTRKRRKKLSSAEGKTAAKVKPTKRQVRKPRKKIASSNNDDAKLGLTSSECRVKEEKIPFVAANGCGHFAGFGAYEAALTARGWRAQLLQDIDLHLLRSVAVIARRQLALEVTGGEQKLLSFSNEASSPHEGVLQELKALSSGIKASQNDPSSMIAAIIAQAEQVQNPERVECAARIGISEFVSTGSGNLMLVRGIERHLLLIVAAVRQYLRARNSSSYTRDGELPHATDKRADLRALQLNIEKMNAELTELAAIISVQAENLSRKDNSATPLRGASRL